MIRVLQNVLAKKGIRVGKFPSTEFTPPDLLALVLAQPWVLEKKSKFMVVQVGANDGISGGDPIRDYIIRENWSGLLIEPQPEPFEQLQQNYNKQTNLAFENVAIAPVKGKVKLFVNPFANTTASIFEGVVKHQNSRADIQEIEVKCLPLSELLLEHKISEVDLLQIDTEGFELSVLMSLDLVRWAPRIIHFEHGHLSRKDLNRVFELLNTHGYRIYFGGRQHQDSLALLQ